MYIGPYEVSEITENGTHFTAAFVDSDVAPITFSNEIRSSIVTPEPMDLNFIRDQRVTPAAKEMLEIILKYAIGVEEIGHLFKTVNESLQHALDQADQKLWGNKTIHRTVKDIDDLLKR